MQRSLRPLRRGIAVAALLSAGLVGCSDQSDAPAASADTDGDAGVIDVGLVDFDFVGLPDTIDAGTRLTVYNDAPDELHELVAFRLSDDDDRAVEELLELPPGALMEALAEPVTVLLAEPGGDQIPAVGDGTLSDPGRYAVLCFIPTGVDPEHYLEVAAETEQGPPQVEGGPPHFVHGMYTEVTVE